MELSDSARNYELAYHVHSNVEEPAVLTKKAEVEKLLTDAGAVITFSQAPERRKLSYPIEHQRQAYFGWIQFTLPDPQAIAGVEEHLRLDNDILRHVVLKIEVESETQKAKAAARIERQKMRSAKEAAVKDEKKGGAIEKQLEDVLTNI